MIAPLRIVMLQWLPQGYQASRNVEFRGLAVYPCTNCFRLAAQTYSASYSATSDEGLSEHIKTYFGAIGRVVQGGN